MKVWENIKGTSEGSQHVDDISKHEHYERGTYQKRFFPEVLFLSRGSDTV